MGFFSGGQFNLVVSFRYVPAAGELGFWCQMLGQASNILFDATDGTHSIGQVLLSPNSMGGADADIWVHPNSDVWPNSTSARLWFPTESLDVSQDFTMWATILAHELSHYVYDVRDEYNNGSVCQGNIATQASIMEGYDWDNYRRWTDAANADYDTFANFFPDFQAGVVILQGGEPTEFCHAGNHNALANNNQNNINGGQSCWTYMANDANHGGIAYGLVAPGAGGPALAAPGGAPVTTCTELIPVQRFMLVLDRSGSMAGAKFTQLQAGANFWVDYVNVAEELGLTTYSGTPNLDSGMSAVPVADGAWRTARHTIVDGLSAGGATAIGDGLRVGLNDILTGGRASSQVMILFTDGLQNAGAETAEDVLPDMVAAGVRCYTIGLGSDQDGALLATIANTTGGRYIAIDGDLDPADAAAAITEALIEIAGESRENGGIVSFSDIDGASTDAVFADEVAPPFNWPAEGENPAKPPSKKDIKSLRFPVTITAGSRHCTLGALWKHTSRNFRVRIFNPGGTVVNPGPQVRRVAAAGRPYSFYEVNNPMPGTWQVEVTGPIRAASFRTIGFEVNNRIYLEMSAVATHIRVGEPIKLRGRLRMPQAVPGAKLTGWMRSPAGKWSKFKFIEHKGATGDREEPFVYTAELKTNAKERGQYLISVDARRAKGVFNLELDELYRLKPGLKPADMKRKVEVPRTRRFALLAVTADREGPTGKIPPAGSNPKPPFIPRNHKKLLARWKKQHPKG